MNRLFGTVCATITPMEKDGSLDLGSLKNLCSYMDENGINGIYPNGTNGEGILLTEAERQSVVDVMVSNYSADNHSVFIQCGSVTPEETFRHVAHAHKAGADGVGIMTPLFFHVDDAALKDYYLEAASTVPADFPLYIYNIPSHTNNDLRPALFAELIDHIPNLRGIKFSAPDLMRIEDYMLAAKRKVDVLIGCDSLYLQCLVSGGVGTVSGPAQVFGKRFSKLYKHYLEGDFEGALEIQRVIVETDRKLASISGIPAIKTLLMMQGVIKNDSCRKPLRALTADEKAILKEELDKYNRES